MKQMRSGTTRVSLRGWELVLAAVALTLLHAAGYAQARRYTNSMSDVTAAAMGAGIETTDFRDYSTTGYAVAGETITVPASADSDGKYRVMLQMQPRAGTLTVNHGGTSLGLVASTLAPSLNQVGVDWQKGVLIFPAASASWSCTASYTGNGTVTLAPRMNQLQKDLDLVNESALYLTGTVASGELLKRNAGTGTAVSGAGITYDDVMTLGTTQTANGAKTFSSTAIFEGGIYSDESIYFRYGLPNNVWAILEGESADNNETSLVVEDPTMDRTITVPDKSGTLAMTSDVTAAISDTAYDAGTWDGVTTIAPSKNAVRDKLEAMTTSIGTKADDSSVVHLAGSETVTGAKSFSGGLSSVSDLWQWESAAFGSVLSGASVSNYDEVDFPDGASAARGLAVVPGTIIKAIAITAAGDGDTDITVALRSRAVGSGTTAWTTVESHTFSDLGGAAAAYTHTLASAVTTVAGTEYVLVVTVDSHDGTLYAFGWQTSTRKY